MKFYEIFYQNIPNDSGYFGELGDKMIEMWADVASMNPRYGLNPELFPLSVVPDAVKPVTFDPNFSTSFSDLCDTRAISLIEEAKKRDLDIVVKYSGGIDSTVALCAILKWIPNDMVSRLSIALTNDSILENPWFFAKYIKPLKVIPFSVSFQKQVIDKSLIVDGLMLDGIIGAGCGVWNGEYNLPHHTNKNILKKYLGEKYFNEKYRYLLEDARKNSPIPVDTIYELMWWQTFNGQITVAYTYPFVYNHQLRKLFYEGEIDSEWVLNMLDHHTVSFYRPPEFQQWALVNMRSGQIVANRSHKRMSLDYISDFIRRPYNNIKVASGVFMHLGRNTSSIGVTDKFEVVSFNDRKAMRILAKAFRRIRL